MVHAKNSLREFLTPRSGGFEKVADEVTKVF